MFLNTNSNIFWGQTDSETIQNAINYAKKTGEDQIIIPRKNERTGNNIWIIDKTVLIPSGMTVIIDNAHLRLADGVFENIFRNENCDRDIGRTLEGEDHNIHVIGIGNATLDGGNSNGLCEQLHRDEPGKHPPLDKNLLIYFHNVRDFEIKGLNVTNSRWWAFAFMFCRFGRISDCDFKMYGKLENEDGIDLRVGCEYITIENITGSTGDDTIALTALPEDPWVKESFVEGKSVDIHDITIRNIMSSTHGCAIIRLLNSDGAKEYNITMTDIKDTGLTLSGVGIFIGDIFPFYRISPRKMGETRNIVIRNFSTCAQKALLIGEPVQDLVIENVVTYGKNQIGIDFASSVVFDNAIIRNFTYRPNKEDAECLFWVRGNDAEAFSDLKFENIRAENTKHVFCVTQLDIPICLYSEPSISYYSPENPNLYSAYGRYHRYFFGEVITNRPPDNRFADEEKNKNLSV
ncbi:MAG: hypothetical protein E7633_08400 [Ruminococcaceae bacterium]|nr:hypothetical protein [Oscillospiraceae bacterium]